MIEDERVRAREKTKWNNSPGSLFPLHNSLNKCGFIFVHLSFFIFVTESFPCSSSILRSSATGHEFPDPSPCKREANKTIKSGRRR